jgi:hypothetical protein
MANIRKSFNFRTGLQVDNDNFVVNTNGLVGIGTAIPQNYLLNVHGDTRVTGLTTSGTLYAGIGTVTTLRADTSTLGVASVTSLKVGSSPTVTNLIGYGYTAWITDNAGVGLHTTSKISINASTSPGASDVELNVFGNVSVTGVVTASSFSGNVATTNLTGTIDNARLPSSMNLSGVVTATTFVGALTGNADTASNLTGSPSITASDVTASNVSASNIITATAELNVGTGGTALTALNNGRLGIGVTNPTSELQIRKASGSLLEVVSDSGQARVSIGQSVGVGNSTGVIRFGTSAHDFDIINNDNNGDINFLLNGNGSAGTGKFSWQDGNSFTELMSLGANGNFSVSGITTLASNGGITTTGGSLYVNNNLSVGGTITATDITLPSIVSDTNLNNSSGITTVAEIHVLGSGSKIGLGTNTPIASIDGIGKTAYLGKVAIGYTEATSELNTYDLAVNGDIKTTSILAESFNFSVASGVMTAPGGFISAASTSPVQILLEGSTLIFNVVGIGSTSFTLS